MLARMQPSFLLAFLLVMFLAVPRLMQAQIHGVAPSVTSFGFGGSNNPTPGVAASVTSLGPNGFGFGRGPIAFGDCCFNVGFNVGRNPRLFPERHHHREHNFFPIGISMPAYIPYAVPYIQDSYSDDEPLDADYNRERVVRVILDRGPESRDLLSRRDLNRPPAPKAAAPVDEAAPAEPVASQPSTVLIFKDGHKADVGNYAIVGDTLFDLADGRTRKILLADLDLPATRKANDDRGVDFQVPASTAR